MELMELMELIELVLQVVQNLLTAIDGLETSTTSFLASGIGIVLMALAILDVARIINRVVVWIHQRRRMSQILRQQPRHAKEI